MSRARRGAVVTGAGRGLGRQTAELLADRGYHVLVTDLDADLAAATAAQIGSHATPMALDVRDADQVQAAADRIVEVAGGLDVWVNNAGVLVTGQAWTQEASVHRLMLEVNALGTIHGTVAAIRTMRQAARGGHVVNIASLAGLTPVPGEAVYAASKHAAVGFSLSTVADLWLAGIDDIDISCICPDGIWTPMLYDKLDDPASALSFSGKLLSPDEVVAAVGKVLDAPREITSLPKWRGAQVRIGAASPRVGRALMPLIIKAARHKQRKIKDRIERSGTA
ncbi:SDR family oxidoreductase [Gordonia sp. (in: high G+C Gram-positive bacteria)]|uniref:SDR family oxidoreductase n=1 Tax=Gordonia sp. (in: high G+C Gram-positive bacteria) TaxID=84139 RepID=UPI003F9C5456